MWDTILHMVDYSATGDTACQHSRWTNVVANIRPVLPEEASYWKGGTESSEKMAMRMSEQKIASWFKKVSGKFSRLWRV